MENSRKKKTFLIIAIILALSSATYAALPVIDVAHIKTTELGFFKELEQLLVHHRYWIQIHGKWQQAVKITKVDQLIKATTKIDINKLGWDEEGPLSKEPATQLAAKSLKEIQDVLDGKTSDLKKVRENLERIYRPAPVTTDGAKSEIALKQASEAIAFVGESNKAIEENKKNIQDFKSKLENGGLTPGDLERYQVLIETYNTELQNVQLQGQNQMIKQQAAELALKASENTNKINKRLEDRFNLLEGMKRVSLTGALKKESKVSTGIE